MLSIKISRNVLRFHWKSLKTLESKIIMKKRLKEVLTDNVNLNCTIIALITFNLATSNRKMFLAHKIND